MGSVRYICIALISLAVPRVAAVQDGKSVEPFIEQVTGRESVVNCGEYARWIYHDKEGFLKSLACAEASVKQHRPSRLVVHVRGTDSLGAYGVLSDWTGQAFFFSYDSEPCGGPGCAEKFTKKPCRVSDVEVVASAEAQGRTYYRLRLKWR
jgi:hypothetical protein